MKSSAPCPEGCAKRLRLAGTFPYILLQKRKKHSRRGLSWTSAQKGLSITDFAERIERQGKSFSTIAIDAKGCKQNKPKTTKAPCQKVALRLHSYNSLTHSVIQKCPDGYSNQHRRPALSRCEPRARSLCRTSCSEMCCSKASTVSQTCSHDGHSKLFGNKYQG